MGPDAIKNKLQIVLNHLPADWLRLTTHRLDRYNEELAKTEFLDRFDELIGSGSNEGSDLGAKLGELPTAFDYIRLGHPLSCVLEWAVAGVKGVDRNHVIAFASRTMPILAVLRHNHFAGVKTRIIFDIPMPEAFRPELLKSVYGYDVEVLEGASSVEATSAFEGHSIFVTDFENLWSEHKNDSDFTVYMDERFGSVILSGQEAHISEIQHVRRRESIAMTPHQCLQALSELVNSDKNESAFADRGPLEQTIREITNTQGIVSLASSGLSMQYAIMMGLIHRAQTKYPGKKIKFIVPPNCYGGTNDQARRVAASLVQVEIVDLRVDRGSDMGRELDVILDKIAQEDAIPYIIAEIPTNPRVEVPDLEFLKNTLAKKRSTPEGENAIEAVFALDQTFCPNTPFLGEEDHLGAGLTISYVSGSKFPSGGLATAGYAVANKRGQELMSYVEEHLRLCDNGATSFQVEALTEQMPSMLERIEKAYANTRSFVDFIEKTLPSAKVNFVAPELAQRGFTPSVFSLDLPAKGESPQERENHKRELNQKLISLMIEALPAEAKHCVSYGQLAGSYWTIPATSTQGTTKEGDKDYIVRVSLSPKLDLEKHKAVFKKFCADFIHSA